MSVYDDVSIAALDGSQLDLSQFKGRATLVVNVASRCGLTPEYAGQEPGTAEEIATFCSSTYGVMFPMTEKVNVNGGNRHPLYTRLTANSRC